MSETRTCKQCRVTKSLEDFPLRRKHGIDYRMHTCRECFNAKRRATRPSKAQPGWTPPPKPFVDNATGIEMKQCTKCNNVKPLSEFGKQRGKIRAICKECAAREQQKRYHNDPEKYREISKAYAQRNPEKVKIRFKAWTKANHKNRLEYHKRYNRQHREEQRIYDKNRRSEPGFHREYYRKYRMQILAFRSQPSQKKRINEYVKRWTANNPQKRADAQQRRRARIANAPRIEKIDRQAIIKRDDSTCYLCGRKLVSDEITLDHVIPLARGGNHTADNLRVACWTCNCKKSTG